MHEQIAKNNLTWQQAHELQVPKLRRDGERSAAVLVRLVDIHPPVQELAGTHEVPAPGGEEERQG